jgi:hypothetical protein
MKSERFSTGKGWSEKPKSIGNFKRKKQPENEL